jgi:DNA-binding CsgD family transcriptional regulator
MDLVITFFSGISLTFGAISLFIFKKSLEQKFYLYFGLFSIFSGLYFLLIAISGHVEIPMWIILFCAASYYAIFPWFIFDFIGKKINTFSKFITILFALAFTVFVINPDPSKNSIWQILAHLGLLGLMGVAFYATKKSRTERRKGWKEFFVLTAIFIFLGLEEIITNYSGHRFLAEYFTGILPLDIYPLLFTVIFGTRLTNEVLRTNQLKVQLIESLLNEEKLKIENLEKKVLQEKLHSKSKDLTDFGIEITRKKEFTEDVLSKLNTYKLETDMHNPRLNELISFTKAHLQIDKELYLFQHKIEVINDEFVAKLKKLYPSLTNNELQLASLLRLKLSTKEISIIKNISPDSAKVLRYRIRKKLKLSSNINLSQFFQDIS